MDDTLIEFVTASLFSTAVLILGTLALRAGLQQTRGWGFILWGFLLNVLGMWMDFLDEFPFFQEQTIHGIVVVDLIEEAFCHLPGALLLVVGFWRWMPAELDRRRAESALDASNRELARRVEELNQARAEADRANRAKSRYLAAMSHDIRTPLNTVIGMGELLAETPLTADQRHYLTTANLAGETLLSLINDILDLAKIESGSLEFEDIPFDLHHLVVHTLRVFRPRAEAAGLVLNHHMAEGVSPMRVGDPTRLRQVLINLIGNAIKFTPRGNVTVIIAPGPTDHLRITVRDTGIGIAPTRQEAIFSPFVQEGVDTTRHYGGSGLGLSICRQIVERMGGEIRVESTPAAGTAFHCLVRLPEARMVIPQEHVPRKGGRDTVHAPQRPLALLLADDAEESRTLFQAYLRHTPHALTLVPSGEQAVAQFTTTPFDLVLMDMQMPGMDGLEATRRIRQWERERNRPPVPIVALTGNALKEDLEASAAAGCDGHLTKPIRKGEFLETIHRYARQEAARQRA